MGATFNPAACDSRNKSALSFRGWKQHLSKSPPPTLGDIRRFSAGMPQKGATFLILNDKDERNGMKGLVVAGIAVASLFAGAAYAAGDSTGAQALAQKNGCMACHGVGNKIVGPAFKDVAAKYKGDKGAEG